jgi:hypothetical protein
MKSGLFDKNGVEIKIGDSVILDEFYQWAKKNDRPLDLFASTVDYKNGSWIMTQYHPLDTSKKSTHIAHFYDNPSNKFIVI